MAFLNYIKVKISEKCKSAKTSYVEVSEVKYLKLRPIVAGPACLTHRLSNLLDIILRPYMYAQRIKSNLRDTTDFLNNLPDRVPPSTLLASFDIEVLYSNIPHELGLETVKILVREFSRIKAKSIFK